MKENLTDKLYLANPYRDLCEAVQSLALSAELQIQLLDRLGIAGGIDELALQLADSCVLLDQLVAHGFVSPKVAELIEQLDSELREMSGSESSKLWTLEALRHDPEWEKIRALARKIVPNLTDA